MTPRLEYNPDSQRRGGAPGAAMSDTTFRRLSSLIYDRCGVKLNEKKKSLLEGRLRKRMVCLGLRSFDEYASFLLADHGGSGEMAHMLDAVTTHKTDFFREPQHFEYLTGVALPTMHSEGFLRGRCHIWSAASSTGEEPYSLAMVAHDYGLGRTGFLFDVLATDISTQVLEHAEAGIYTESRVLPVPAALRERYVLRSKDRAQKLVRMAPELRACVEFRNLNLMDPIGLRNFYHVIFCRNVIIYFERKDQINLVRQFHDALVPGGYLFMGHSESLNGFGVPLQQESATIYRKPS